MKRLCYLALLMTIPCGFTLKAAAAPPLLTEVSAPAVPAKAPADAPASGQRSSQFQGFEALMNSLEGEPLPVPTDDDAAVTQDFDSLMEAISEGINAPAPAPIIEPMPSFDFAPIARHDDEAPMPSQTGLQEAPAQAELPVKAEEDKPSFFSRLFGLDAVTHEEIAEEQMPEEMAKKAQGQALQPSPAVQQTIVRAGKAVPKTDPTALLPEDFYPPTRMNSLALRKSQADAMEYKELIESLTTKIQLLENEKQSLRQALRQGNNRVLLP